MSRRRSLSRPDLIGRAPRNRRQWVMVAYDIPDDRRRLQVMKLLSGYGVRVQYSVFECELKAGDVEELQRRLRTLIKRESDDVRVYPLCGRCVAAIRVLGRGETHRHQPYVIVP